jgi:signal transduction histidine kinase/ActR/RegA family two-component response regulator
MLMKDERKTESTGATEKQLEAALEKLERQLAEANSRVAELAAEKAELDQARALLGEYEERIHQLDRLAAVGQLAGGIAHDFGNFLTTNIFHVELLRNDPRLSPELLPTVETILDGARRTAQLVRQILDFSRRTTLRSQSIDMAAFVDEIATILRRTLPENIRLVVDVSAEELVANIDPARMEQVLMNLALNARDAMPEGGELRIGLSRVEVDLKASPSIVELSLSETKPVEMPAGIWVCLSVSDTGTGITEDVRLRLFEPFFTTKGEEGTGLGLAQVYGIVRQHDGHIGVETEIRQGTTFRVYLPACDRGEMGEDSCGMSVAPRGKGETILFVEDEEKLRDVGRATLESLGYRVLVAENGLEALEVYKAVCAGEDCEIDLVITDVVMPEMGGKVLIKELKKIRLDVKVLAISGYVLKDDLQALKETGILGTIQKPFEVEALAAATRRALDAD